MSIHIGLVPVSQNSNDVFTIYSSRSNLMRIQSLSNNVFMDVGDYKLGQRSNEPFVFSHKDSNIIAYDSKVISLNRDIVAASNLDVKGSLNIVNNITCPSLNTSNIIVENIIDGYRFLECTSNNIDTFYVTNNTGYLGGSLGIGVTPDDPHYSLMTQSNVFVDGEVVGKSLSLEYMNISSNELKAKIFFNFDSNALVIDANKVIVNNFTLGDTTKFTLLECEGIANMSGLLLATELNITNKSQTKNPFKINQRLISSQYGNNILGNPISVISEHRNVVTDPTIFELSSCGNLILGDYPKLANVGGLNIINDHMIRGNIPFNRERHFKGYLSFSSNSSEKTAFTVNKSGQVSIGSSSPGKALLEIVNGFTSFEPDYVKPSSIIYLNNSNRTNELPFLKCENSNIIKFQITSNATLCFNDAPIDIYSYNIESDKNYLKNIDTLKIASYDDINGIIDMSFSRLSNINNIYSCNIDTSNLRTSNAYVSDVRVDNGYIQNLKVGSFSTIGLGDQTNLSIFSIGSDHLSVYGSNIVISTDRTLFDNPPSFVDIKQDKVIIQTKPSLLDVNACTIYGNNKSIKILCKNTSSATDSYVVQELQNGTGGFAFVSKIANVGASPELYITPLMNGLNPYANPAIIVGNDKKVLINNLETNIMNIREDLTVSVTSDVDFANKHVCLQTNKYGSLDIGRGLITGDGPFNKQGGWTNVNSTTGEFIISNTDYGVRNNTSGTLYVQVKGVSKLGNASISFLRSTTTAEIFTISRHKTATLSIFTITAVSEGIKITTDINCKVCWTSIGSC